MPDPASYSWAATLQNAVPIGDSFTLQTPGMANPSAYDTANAEVVYGGEVLHADEFSLEWASDFTSVEIFNQSDEDWPVQDTIALAVSGVPFDPTDLQDAFTQIEARLTAVENRSTENEARITTLEAEMATVQAVLIPHVTNQYFENVSLAAYDPANRVIMQANNSPTHWEIVFETQNDLPTTGYWTIDDTGAVGLTPEGAAAFAPGDKTVVEVRAENANGHGDGTLTMYMVA
jgi:hypothetical protein